MYSFMCIFDQIYIHFGKLDTLQRNPVPWTFLDVKNLGTFRRRGFEITTLYDVAENSQFFFGCLDLGYPTIPLWDPRARCVQHLQRIFQRSAGIFGYSGFPYWIDFLDVKLHGTANFEALKIDGELSTWCQTYMNCLCVYQILNRYEAWTRSAANPLHWVVAGLFSCLVLELSTYNAMLSQLSSLSCHSLWGCHLQRSDYNKYWVDEDHSGAPKIAKLVYD